MGTNCAPLLADLSLYSFEAKFIQKILREEYMAFNSTFSYIDDVLSINNDQFHSFVDSIYPSELEIKDTTESSTDTHGLSRLLLIMMIRRRDHPWVSDDHDE
jgi:hypothetical protein